MEHVTIQGQDDTRTRTALLLGASNAHALLPLLDLLAHPNGFSHVARFAKGHKFVVVHSAAVVGVEDFGDLLRLLVGQLKPAVGRMNRIELLCKAPSAKLETTIASTMKLDECEL